MAPKLARLPDVHFVFVTEETYYKATRERIAQTGALHSKKLRLVPYLHNMAQMLVDGSLIVRRSGASSLAENEGDRPAAILIPSPNVTNNHQEAMREA